VAQHAQVAKLQITLSYLGDTLLLDGPTAEPALTSAPPPAGTAWPAYGSGWAGPGRGMLTVESFPGSGTIPNASVPLAGPAEGATRRPTAIRLLIVDDHPVMRDGLRGVLATTPATGQGRPAGPAGRV
jgi:hypothetical protein